MPFIYLETVITAPQKIVFDLSRSVDLHKASMVHHKEKIAGGSSKGLMNKDDTVTWSAVHLFKSRKLKVRITEMNSPHSFTDEMIQGDFKRMKHEHFFKPLTNGTLMIDQFYFESPFGILGKLASILYLEQYMTRLLKDQNEEIKKVAESNQCEQFLNTNSPNS